MNGAELGSGPGDGAHASHKKLVCVLGCVGQPLPFQFLAGMVVDSQRSRAESLVLPAANLHASSIPSEGKAGGIPWAPVVVERECEGWPGGYAGPAADQSTSRWCADHS